MFCADSNDSISNSISLFGSIIQPEPYEFPTDPFDLLDVFPSAKISAAHFVPRLAGAVIA